MTTLTTDQIWWAAWDEALKEQHQYTQVPESEWRSAGRATKAKPRGEDVDFWRLEGLQHALAYEAWLHRTGWEIAEFNGNPLVEFNVSGRFGDIEVKGYIDAVFDTPSGLIIVDYKTGSRSPAGPHQLALYSVMLADLGLPAPEWGAFYKTRTAELGPVESLMQWDRTWWEKQFNLLATAKENSIFLPAISDHCRGCGVRNFCFAFGGSQSAKYDPDNPNFVTDSNSEEGVISE